MRNFNVNFRTTLRVPFGPRHVFQFVTVMNIEKFTLSYANFQNENHVHETEPKVFFLK